MILSGSFIRDSDAIDIEKGLLALILVPVFSISVVRFGWSKARSTKSLGDIVSELEFGVLFVVLTAVLIHITGFFESPLYPLMYITASILALTIRPGLGIPLVILLILCDVVPVLRLPEYSPSELLQRLPGSLFFYAFFLFYNYVENRRKNKMLLSLRRYEEDLREVKTWDANRDYGVSDENIERDALVTLSNIDDVLYRFLDHAKRSLSLNTIAYLVPKDLNETLKIREAASSDDDFVFDSTINGEFSEKVSQIRKPILLTGGKDGYIINPGYYKDKPRKLTSLAIVPVMGNSGIMGILVCDSIREGGISPQEIPLLELVSETISDAQDTRLDNSRLKMDLKESLELNSVSEKLSRAEKISEVYRIVFDSILRMLPEKVTKVMAFSTVRGDESEVVAVRGRGEETLQNHRFTNQGTLTGWALNNRQYLVYPGRNRGKNVFGGKFDFEKRGALLIFPLSFENTLMGTFTYISMNDDIPTRFHLRLVETIVNMAAVSLKGLNLMLRIKKMAITDPLTGLYNRRRFNSALKEHFDRAERFSEEMSVLMVDIDFFKKVNDTYGHQAGDEVIKGVAETILGATRRVDVVGRVGGEEFAVILPRTPFKSAEVTAKRILKAVEKKKVIFGKNKLSVTVSIGLSLFSGGEKGVDELLREADRALYMAKEGGRNRYIAV